MRLPILISARPSLLKESAKVSLGVGVWRIESNVMDSILHIVFERPHTTPNGQARIKDIKEYKGAIAIQFDGPCIIYLTIQSPGSEKYLDVYAEKVA